MFYIKLYQLYLKFGGWQTIFGGWQTIFGDRDHSFRPWSCERTVLAVAEGGIGASESLFGGSSLLPGPAGSV